MAKEIIFNKPVDGALFLFRRGFKVFPCKPNMKEPAFPGWQKWAESATEKKITDFGTANALHNWGVSCGPSNLLVVDLDNKKGKQGSKVFTALCADKGPVPATLTVQTTTGGQHLYFVGQGKNSVELLGEGIDTRGVGGYVVAPGSRIDEEPYRIILDGEAKPLPAWIATLLETKAEAKNFSSDSPIIEGERNSRMTSFAGTMRRAGANHDTLLAALLEMNDTQVVPPLPQEEVEIIARSVAKYAPEIAEAAADFLTPTKVKAIRASSVNVADIPKRDWIMKNRFIGGFISVVVAPGGVGKSTLTMLDAIAVASGKSLTGFEVLRRGGAWIYNTEDPIDEMKRKLAAISMHHQIPLHLLENVHVTSGRDNPLILAKGARDGVVTNQGAIDEAVAYIREHKIALLLVDPFVRSHECNENDNMQIDKVVWCFQRIAEATGCAVCLVHHTSKAGSQSLAGEDGSANAARGASALVNAARIAHVLTTMNEDEAKKFAIAPDLRRWYMRLDNAKANLQPPAEAADWYKKISIELLNGDAVGTVERVELSDKRAERAQEDGRAELCDLARCLSGLMVAGDTMSLNEVMLRVFTNSRFAHLFNYSDKSEKTLKRKLASLLGPGPVAYQKKGFVLEQGQASEGRAKIWVACFSFDGDGVDPERVIDPSESYPTPVGAPLLLARALGEAPEEVVEGGAGGEGSGASKATSAVVEELSFLE